MVWDEVDIYKAMLYVKRRLIVKWVKFGSKKARGDEKKADDPSLKSAWFSKVSDD